MRRGVLPGLLLAIALADLVFLALPTLVVLVASFTPGNIVAFPPEGFSLRWYAHLAGKPDFLAALWRSLQVGLVCTLLAVPAGTLAALALGRIGGMTRKGVNQAGRWKMAVGHRGLLSAPTFCQG